MRAVQQHGPSPRPGDTVLGCFRLTETIGSGSFATAYLAEQLGTDRLAVVKIPHRHMLAGPHGEELRRRFEAEARASTRTKHPNLVTVYLVGETHYGLPAIAMEYIVGETLGERLTRCAPLDDEELGSLGVQLADVLATLHGVGIVHRDLSPSNVLLQDRAGESWVKLVDFGVAKLLDVPGRTVGPMGTPGYVAPEQLIGDVGPRTDVYSLGALLWWCLTGHERPDDFHDGSLRARIGSLEGPDPRSIRPDAPDGFSELVRAALIPEPSARPTMSQFLEAWRQLASPARVTASRRATTSASGRFTPVSFTPTGSAGLAHVSPTSPTLLSSETSCVAVVMANPVLRAQVLSFLDTRAMVEQPSARELGRTAPGSYDVAIVDEQLPEVGTRGVLTHLRRCYPDLPVLVAGPDAGRRSEWLAAGAEGFIEVPHELPDLAMWLEGVVRTNPDANQASSKLRRTLVDTLRQTDPARLARSLEAFIGCVPQWLAEIELGLGDPQTQRSCQACEQLVIGAEAVGADSLARIARATCQSLRNGERETARTFLGAAEREYREVFRDAFELMNTL
jgi:serine/threonine protein kinase